MAYPRNIVGLRVRELREQQGLTQPMLAAKCNLLGWNLSRETLAKIESRIRWVSDCELLCLAKALGVEVPDLIPAAASTPAALRAFLKQAEHRS